MAAENLSSDINKPLWQKIRKFVAISVDKQQCLQNIIHSLSNALFAIPQRATKFEKAQDKKKTHGVK